ncbi:MAG TPA: creatininase family protein [Actinocatenispora sp.]
MAALAEMTRTEARSVAPHAIAVLPIGATEQHAEHLPMGTDAMLVDAVLDAALDRLPARIGIVRAPTLPYGSSEHHLFSAALSLRPTTLLPVLTDLLRSLVVTGFRRLMVVNGHGGNEEIMRLAVKQTALEHPVAVAAASYWALGEPDAATRVPGHAGWYETSLMLAHRADLVRPQRTEAAAEPPVFDRPPWPGLVVEKHGEWARVGGFTDAATDSTAATGTDLLARRAAELAGAIVAFDAATTEFRRESDAP